MSYENRHRPKGEHSPKVSVPQLNGRRGRLRLLWMNHNSPEMEPTYGITFSDLNETMTQGGAAKQRTFGAEDLTDFLQGEIGIGSDEIKQLFERLKRNHSATTGAVVLQDQELIGFGLK